jgi:uncharacterized protein
MDRKTSPNAPKRGPGAVILWDTGPPLAAFDRRDKHHAACADLIASTPPPLLVPAPVMVEVCYFLQERVGPRAEAAFLRSITAWYYSDTLS